MKGTEIWTPEVETFHISPRSPLSLKNFWKLVRVFVLKNASEFRILEEHCEISGPYGGEYED